jgi:hypothetical protein
MVAETAEARLTLPSHQEFTTDDPELLGKQLSQEHEDIAEELEAIGDPPKRWHSVVATLPIVSAAPFDSIVCLGFDITVRPPPNPQPGQVFRVFRAASGNITVQADDGRLINGAAASVLNVVGFREFEFELDGWYSNA